MGPNIIPEYRKQFTTGGSEKSTESLREMKDRLIKRALELPPILARGFRDYLITVDLTTEPTSAKWIPDKLEPLTIDMLMNLVTLLENRQENETRRY